jgi:hypothetical protein
MTVNYLENQFTSHELCDENHEWWVETRVQALLTSVDNTPLWKVRPCNIHKLVNSLKLRKACGLGSPNECLRHLPRRPLVNPTDLFNYCLWLSHFSKSLKQPKVLTLPTHSRDRKFPQNLHPFSLLSIRGRLFKKIILKTVQRHTEERGLLNASLFGFCACHDTTLQCIRLTDHITLNFVCSCGNLGYCKSLWYNVAPWLVI